MRETMRLLCVPPPGAPTKVWEEGRESEIPYFCRWSDGSWYRAEWIDEPHLARRSFAGPLFKTPFDKPHREALAWS